MANIDTKEEREVEIPTLLPILPVRDIVIFPYMILPLFVGREVSIKAIEHALASNKMVLLITQKDVNVETPVTDDLYTMGTAGTILRTLKLPELTIEIEALMRSIKEQMDKSVSLGKSLLPDVMVLIENIDDPGKLADLVASNLSLKAEQAQEILEITDPGLRLKKISEILNREVELLIVQQKIQSDAKGEIDKTQREYFLREQLKAIQKKLV